MYQMCTYYNVMCKCTLPNNFLWQTIGPLLVIHLVTPTCGPLCMQVCSYPFLKQTIWPLLMDTCIGTNLDDRLYMWSHNKWWNVGDNLSCLPTTIFCSVIVLIYTTWVYLSCSIPVPRQLCYMREVIISPSHTWFTYLWRWTMQVSHN